MKLIRFYQQYKLEDFINMDVSTLSIFIRGMRQLAAEEQLHLMDAMSYPQSDQKSRRASHKKWNKEAYPENFEEKILKTTDLELF